MRRKIALATSVVLATMLSLLSAPATAATGNSYVALGDSYASGVGSRIYYVDGTSCYRSPKAYGSQVASAYRLPLVLAACSGAVTNDVTNTQLSSVGATTGYVTITVGGNDLGFTSVLTECAMPGWMSNCNGAVLGGLRVLTNDLPARLDLLLARVRSRAPGAKMVVAGYPHLFNGEDCSAATFFSPTEQANLNFATDRLNRLLSTKAAIVGATFVNPVSRFSTHAWCSSTEWINGLSTPAVNSYHPNLNGHSAYARLVGPALVGRPLPLPTLQTPTASASVALPRKVTASRPFNFTVPDLNSARAKRAAGKAGITRGELNRLRAAQRRGASNATLERMNRAIILTAQQRR